MDNANLILKIQASYNQLTKAERKVADYVIQNKKQVLYMSITDLADACAVGDTSVYRFCRTMKLEGYQDFKVKLSLALASSDPEFSKSSKKKASGKKDPFLSAAENIMQLHIGAIRETFQLLSKESFENTLTLMLNANRIFFFGIGDSLLTAEEARNKFLRITDKVICLSDPHMQAMAASTSTKKDLIIIISYSGATKDNIHVARKAKEAGAKIACITHFQKSPLTAYSDTILLCGSNEGPLEGGSMTAKMSQLYLIDLLFQEYYERTYEHSMHNNELTSNAIVEKLF